MTTHRRLPYGTAKRQTLDDLRRARHLIRTPDRWVQGAWRHPGGGGRPDRYCAVGAINAAVSRRDADGTLDVDAAAVDPIYVKHVPNRAFNRAYDAYYAVGGPSLMQVNDTNGTTHAKILGMFDRAIAKLRAEVEPVPSITTHSYSEQKALPAPDPDRLLPVQIVVPTKEAVLV